MTEGIDINIKGVTNGNHWDMIQRFLVDRGELSKMNSYDLEEFLSGKITYYCNRDVRGINYRVEISYNPDTDTFIAKCS